MSMPIKSNNTLELRPMSERDIPRVLSIIAEYDEDDAYDAQETYEESIDHQYCLFDRNQVIGVIGAKPIENTLDSYGLSWTYLQRSDRRSGKGSQMLTWVIDIMRERGGRKAFVHASDYLDPEEGDVYFDAREAYMRMGFSQELKHPDYYAPGESMLVYGMRLQQRGELNSNRILDDIKITDVDEIPETNNAFWIAWELVPSGQGSTVADLERVFREVKSWGGRSIFMAFPSEVVKAAELLPSAKFRIAGRLMDYYEDGIDEVHYRYDLLG